MKRKLTIITIAIILFALLIPGTAAAASGGGDAGGDIEITLSDVTIDGDPMVGDTVTISGSATVTSEASVDYWLALFPDVEAYAEAIVQLISPGGGVAYSDIESDYDHDWGIIGPEDAEASVNFDWSFDYTFPNMPGLWTLRNAGYGYYDLDYNIWFWHFSEDDEEYQELLHEFYVGIIIREMYFTFTPSFGHGQAQYPDDSMNPSPIDREIKAVGRYDGIQYLFVIPKGTVITNGAGLKALGAYFPELDGNVLRSTYNNQSYSNPVTVYRAEGVFHVNEYGQYVGGEWIEIGSFTEVVDGQAIIE